jgi:hypothetical protein
MKALRLSPTVALPILILFALQPQTTPASTPASAVSPGDIDCDGSVTVFDALGLLASASGIVEPGACAAANGDLTCDERQDEQDVVEILSLLAELNRLECGGEPTSLALIGKALVAGDIDEEEAALYSVFAVFDDPRLPGEFSAPTGGSMEPPVDLNLIGSQLESFSEAVQEQLGPYFIPPMHQGSWWDLRYGSAAAPSGLANPGGPVLDGAWGFVDAQTAAVKFWYPLADFGLRQLAQDTAQEVDSYVWPQLTALMGRSPLPDGGSVLPGRGGDDRIDIIVSNDMPTFGALGRAPNWCERTSAIIFAPPDEAARLQVPFHIAIAHELMHAFQFSYDLLNLPGGSGGCGVLEYAWWAEASATWIEQFLYPETNTEHTGPRGDRNVKSFIGDLGKPLESGGDAFRGTNLERPYGAYLWAFYMSHEYGDQTIRQAWDNMQTAGALEAMEQVLQPHGGFAMVWPDFVVAVANKEPFDVFRQWDDVDQEPDYNGTTYRDHEEQIDLSSYHFNNGQDGYRSIDWLGDEHLSATFNSYQIVDEDVRSITFYNGYYSNVTEETSETGNYYVPLPRPEAETRGLKVEALIKIAGQEWIREDWTYFPVRTFCRDTLADRVEEVIIITSNSVPETDHKIESPEFPFGPKMFVSDIGCWRWEGTISSVVHGEGWEMTTTVNDVVLQRDEAQSFPFTAPYGVNYIPVSGTMDWSHTGSIGDCAVNGSATGMTLVEQHSLQTIIDIISGPFARAASGSFYPQQTFVTYTMTCPGDPPEQAEWPPGISFPPSAEAFKLDDGSVISGSMHHESSNTDFTWHFEAQRE